MLYSVIEVDNLDTRASRSTEKHSSLFLHTHVILSDLMLFANLIRLSASMTDASSYGFPLDSTYLFWDDYGSLQGESKLKGLSV